MLGDMNMTQFMLKVKIDFEFFCNRVLSDTFKDGGIQEYMLEWFNLIQENDRVIIEAARGFAKTTILGLAYPLWLAFTKRNKQVMVTSASEAQAKRVLGLMKKEIETNPLLRELKPVDYRETWSAKEIKTNTNCRLFCKPFTKSVLGERLDYILMDEANKYENPELYFDYIIPTLNPGGKIAIISSSEKGDRLINLIKEKELDSYKIKSYPAIVNGKSIWEKRFSLAKLKKIEAEQGHEFFQKNFMCNPISESGLSIFTAASIRDAKDKNSTFTSKHLGGDVFMGCDFAIASGATADFDAYIIIESFPDGGQVILKHGETHKGWSVPAKVERLIELFEIHKPQVVICDESSIGAAVIGELRVAGIPVEAQSFQSRSRNSLLNNLKTILDNRRIKIPADPNDPQTKTFLDKLEKELLSFEEKSLQNTTSYVSTGAHDDTAMALAMAVKRVRNMRDVQDYWGIA